jgi:hypothetical protein
VEVPSPGSRHRERCLAGYEGGASRPSFNILLPQYCPTATALGQTG